MVLQCCLPSYQLIGIDGITGVHYGFLMELAELVSSPAIELPSLSVGYELFSVIAWLLQKLVFKFL